MKAWLAIGMLGARGAAWCGGETKLGTGVTLKETTAIKALVEQPAAYVGKTFESTALRPLSARTWGAGWRWRPRATRRAPRFGSRSTMA